MPGYPVGDHLSWTSEVGRNRGAIIKVHHGDFDDNGHRQRASSEAPQHEFRSDKTGHVAAHKVTALTKLD